MSLERAIAIRVDANRCSLAFAHLGELHFLEVRFDPKIVRGDECKHRTRRVHVVANLQLFHLCDHAAVRRIDRGVGEVERGATELGLRLLNGRMLVGIDRRIAAEVGDSARDLLLSRGNRLRGGVACVHGAIDLGL